MIPKLAIIVLALAAFVPAVSAQRRTTPAKTFPKPTVAVKPQRSAPAVIAEDDWNRLAVALNDEDWDTAAALAAADLKIVTEENAQRQLAQLRYLQMFAISGQILKLYAAGKRDEADARWIELDRVVTSNFGKEIVLPARQFASDCTRKLNFICRVKDSDDMLRTTATNREGDGIHSFDYVKFDGAVPALADDGRKIFIGGVLENADYNDEPEKPWVLRLHFKGGFIVESGI